MRTLFVCIFCLLFSLAMASCAGSTGTGKDELSLEAAIKIAKTEAKGLGYKVEKMDLLGAERCHTSS